MPSITDSDDSEELEMLLLLVLLLFADDSDDESYSRKIYTKKELSLEDRLEVKRSKIAR
jgi:hypothetical protein